MTRFSIAMIIAFFAFALPAGTASAAGFDCSKASAADEKAVCGNSRLSQLDSEMTGLWYSYSRIPMLMGGSGERQTEADAFLARRRQCGSKVDCLAAAYADRIADLKGDIAGAMSSIQPFITGGGNPQSSVPTPIAPALTDYATKCSQAGGSLANAEAVQVLAGDVDGDELFDYVVNPAPLQCQGAATALCANDGCDIRLYLSRDQYAKPVSIPGGQPTLVQRDGRTDAEIWVSRFNCNAAPGTPCWAVYSWKDGKLGSRFRTGSDDGSN